MFVGVMVCDEFVAFIDVLLLLLLLWLPQFVLLFNAKLLLLLRCSWL